MQAIYTDPVGFPFGKSVFLVVSESCVLQLHTLLGITQNFSSSQWELLWMPFSFCHCLHFPIVIKTHTIAKYITNLINPSESWVSWKRGHFILLFLFPISSQQVINFSEDGISFTDLKMYEIIPCMGCYIKLSFIQLRYNKLNTVND